MADQEFYIVKIDQLPETKVAAQTPAEVSRAIALMISESASLRRLADDEPVQIKRPDRTAWGRNLTLGAYRNDAVDHDTEASEGPIHRSSIAGD